MNCTEHVCETCGKPAICGVNDHWFCEKHWDSGLREVVRPMLEAIYKDMGYTERDDG